MPLGLHTASLNFETLQEIGQEGRNSQVYLAHDKQLDGEIVVKKISKTKLQHATEYYNEAKILYASAHPNVVRVNYGCSDDMNIYIAMPYYKNGSLKRLITSRYLSIKEVIRYSIQFLSGLNNIHSKKLLHFDVKPDNILLSDSNEALLSDFGLAKAMDDFGFADPDAFYPKQIPPELFTSSQKTLHFDIYLAGLTIYRLLNGNDHFHSQFSYRSQEDYIRAVINGDFPDRTSYLPHVPIRLQRIVNKALSVNINDRHKNVLELINELSGVEENLDWLYSKNENSETWVRKDPDKLYQVSLECDGNRYTVVSTKTIISTRRTTKIKKHCCNNLPSTNVLSKLKGALRELCKAGK